MGLRTQKGRAVQPEQEPFRSSPPGRECVPQTEGDSAASGWTPAEESGKLNLQDYLPTKPNEAKEGQRMNMWFYPF